MLDIRLRPLKDQLFDPVCAYIPSSIKPLHVTVLAFVCGLSACICAVNGLVVPSVLFWTLNRAFDCLDGALARYRKTASELGGFLDLLCDFIVYAVLPIAVASGQKGAEGAYRAVSILEATVFINNFILFYIAAVAEKKASTETKDQVKTKQLTSLVMRPALIEGTESAVLFTAMLAFPRQIKSLSLTMAGLVSIGIVQRTYWTIQVLK